MTNELLKPQKVIVMKSKLPIWVDEDRAEHLIGVLATGTGHKFVKIDEMMINSTEIEGIYTPIQYDEITKIKQGGWQCVRKTWHGKKEECQCANQAFRRLRELQQKREEDEMNKKLTPEQIESRKKTLDKMREELKKAKIIK